MSDSGVRTLWVGSGWKMNKIRPEAKNYASRLNEILLKRNFAFNVFVAPPFTSLCDVVDVLEKTQVKVCAQNMHWEESGAYTGEISPDMISACGAHMVELGHFERRTFFGESDYTVNKKVLAALRHGLFHWFVLEKPDRNMILALSGSILPGR